MNCQCFVVILPFFLNRLVEGGKTYYYGVEQEMYNSLDRSLTFPLTQNICKFPFSELELCFFRSIISPVQVICLFSLQSIVGGGALLDLLCKF
jgi:hypothetical protein